MRDTCIIEAHICVSDFLPKINIAQDINPQALTTDQSSDESPGTSSSGSSTPSSEHLTLRELMDFESLGPEELEANFVPLLEEVCMWHPSLIQCQRKRTRWFRQWAFTSLGQVLHFLKRKKVKDMSEGDIKSLERLWEELVKSSGFDLDWLEPYVQSALGVKAHLERAEKVKKLKDSVVGLEIKMKKLRGELAAAEAQFEVARKGLSEVRKGFQEMNVNAPIGYAMF